MTSQPIGKASRLPIVAQKLDPRCAICEQLAPLSEDHVFPRCLTEHLRVRIRPVYASDGTAALSQSGVRFKTLCGDCNSLLGHKYDPSLCALVKQVRNWDRTNIVVSERARFEFDVDAVTLAIFGHVLAGSTLHPEMVPDEKMRASLLARRVLEDAPNVFYWIARDAFPTIVRGLVTMRVTPPKTVYFLSIFKCPPIGFAISSEAAFEGLPKLGADRANGIIRFWPRLARPYFFPEKPDRDQIIGTGAPSYDSRIAYPIR